ncbi:hypothetical protein Pcinc_024832 [Petrolisthes cinctipes]|uniref:Uncharacterized protein n=1 Tax=Petrolisthes cinctipes TaxID=88211 RepID=A0AAE1KCF9_PETCI|nr:hypothetical protein Pcinc_024832 [Petrolisthes cinctipes]
MGEETIPASSSADKAVVGRGCPEASTPLPSPSVSRGEAYSSTRCLGSPSTERATSQIGGGTVTWEALLGVKSPSPEETPREAEGASSEEVRPRLGGLHNLRNSRSVLSRKLNPEKQTGYYWMTVSPV